MKKLIIQILVLGIFISDISAQNAQKLHRIQFTVFAADSIEIETYSLYLRTGGGQLYSVTADGIAYVPSDLFNVQVNASGYLEKKFDLKIEGDSSIEVYLDFNAVQYANASVRAVYVREKSGFVYTNVSQAKLAPVNLGQDFTYLIGNTPSAVSTSDAGAGVGYTGIRIRGSDATRINVTINGIPINDAESHGVFWVNMPDLASSASTVQIQRGVGSSTIGTGAFGANINVLNSELGVKPFLQLQQSAGSFGTFKSTMQFGTGRMGNFNFGGRLSKIVSDGYIDRASSNLQAFQFNLNYNKSNWDVQAVSFGGKEKTYQSWWGTPESRVKGDVQGMNDYVSRNWLNSEDSANLLNSGRTYNYYRYKNQTDNYWQNHYQLHISKTFGTGIFLRSSFFTTTGKGFYEEFKSDALFASYGVDDFKQDSLVISSTDLIRQRWLDNVYFGNFTSLGYKNEKHDVIAGLSYTQYNGKHFGEVIWAEIAAPFGKDFRYYESRSQKKEANGFVKYNYKVDRKLQFDGEFQLRNISYTSKGDDNDGSSISFDTSYLFLNPKLGVIYETSSKSRIYSSYSIGSREPVRTDFIDNASGNLPKPETMGDLELGYIYKDKSTYYQFNFYHMNYWNQLVITGELNDVGSVLRRNVARSYRTGVELIVQQKLTDKLFLDANLNLSINKIKNFEDVYFDYDSNSYIRTNLGTTDIAMSPSVVGFFGITDKHFKNLDLNANIKYVGNQYLDNTLNKSARLNPYYILNLSAMKTYNLNGGSKLTCKFMVNNLTGIFYSNNGYTYKYVYFDKMIRENFYYPQSRQNFMIGLDYKFL